jgi:hypothetical protein
VVDLPFFFDFVDGRQTILVQDNTEKFLGRRATVTCASLHAAGMFIDSQNLFGDCFLGSCNDRGSAFVLAVLKAGGGRSLRWLQEILEIILYFLIS